MTAIWKENWEETKQHFRDWWGRKGPVISFSGKADKREKPYAQVENPGLPSSLYERYTNTKWIADNARYNLSGGNFIADNLPIADVDIGPGSLALYLGSEPGFTKDSVWFHPCITDPEKHPPLLFNPENKWCKIHEETLKEAVKVSGGNYFAGCQDLVENIDVLASLRGVQALLMDIVDRPEWVKEKVFEINKVFFKAYERIYNIIKLEDGSACFSAFGLWGEGKTAKVQCDASVMISTESFNEIVLPGLKEQCEWLDYSMYHLDGSREIRHLDSLLSIEALDAIEWTPEPNVPRSADKYWQGMYRRILKAGKSIQLVNVDKNELIPLLDDIGTKGIYVKVYNVNTIEEAEKLLKDIEKIRSK